MKQALAITAMIVSVFFLSTSPRAIAKEGFIVKGDNGTKWCCPPPSPGKKGPDCEKGASTIPVGKRCNFAGPGKLVPINPRAPILDGVSTQTPNTIEREAVQKPAVVPGPAVDPRPH